MQVGVEVGGYEDVDDEDHEEVNYGGDRVKCPGYITVGGELEGFEVGGLRGCEKMWGRRCLFCAHLPLTENCAEYDRDRGLGGLFADGIAVGRAIWVRKFIVAPSRLQGEQ